MKKFEFIPCSLPDMPHKIIWDSDDTEPNINVGDENLILSRPKRVVKPPERLIIIENYYTSRKGFLLLIFNFKGGDVICHMKLSTNSFGSACAQA